MTVRDAIRGFYAILDRDDETLAKQLVFDGGARVLQLRIKPHGTAPPTVSELLRIGAKVARICEAAGAAFIVNDRIDVALALDATGVHLGQTDLPLAAARTIAPRLWIGVSTHDLDQVRAACAGGADYLGYGPIFATTTKANPDAVQGIAALRAATAAAGATPVVAIGGITAPHVRDLYAAGAAALCAVSAVNAAADPIAAAKAFSRG